MAYVQNDQILRKYFENIIKYLDIYVYFVRFLYTEYSVKFKIVISNSIYNNETALNITYFDYKKNIIILEGGQEKAEKSIFSNIKN